MTTWAIFPALVKGDSKANSIPLVVPHFAKIGTPITIQILQTRTTTEELFTTFRLGHDYYPTME